MAQISDNVHPTLTPAVVTVSATKLAGRARYLYWVSVPPAMYKNNYFVGKQLELYTEFSPNLRRFSLTSCSIYPPCHLLNSGVICRPG
jgi:hypothetical protein